MAIGKEKTEKIRMWTRDWRKYKPQLLREKLARVDWNITCAGIQDYNDEMEHKIMTVLEDIIPFKWRTLGKKKLDESPYIASLKWKKKTYLQMQNAEDLQSFIIEAEWKRRKSGS